MAGKRTSLMKLTCYRDVGGWTCYVHAKRPNGQPTNAVGVGKTYTEAIADAVLAAAIRPVRQRKGVGRVK